MYLLYCLLVIHVTQQINRCTFLKLFLNQNWFIIIISWWKYVGDIGAANFDSYLLFHVLSPSICLVKHINVPGHIWGPSQLYPQEISISGRDALLGIRLHLLHLLECLGLSPSSTGDQFQFSSNTYSRRHQVQILGPHHPHGSPSFGS